MTRDEAGANLGAGPHAGTARAVLLAAAEALRHTGDPQPRLTAEILLGHILGWNRARVLAALAEPVAPDCLRKFSELVQRRAAGEPLQYITGRQEFYGLEFVVSRAVLIPRPETELLVEQALSIAGREQRKTVRFVDVGTGSGCIAAAFARHREAAIGWAADMSHAALEIARQNIEKHGVAGRVGLVCADLLACFRRIRAFDLVLANLPYLSRRDEAGIGRSVIDHEPQTALFAGETGSESYARLFPQAATVLGRGGHLLLEMDPPQADALQSLAEQAGFEVEAILNDLRGLPRCIVTRRRDG